MSSNDEMVSQFMAFTGSEDAERAKVYLEMSGGNLETAVGLFMEHGGGGAAGGGAAGASGGGGNSNSMADDIVRAPDATQTMRLMDDGPQRMMGVMGGIGNPYIPMAMMNPMVQQQLATSAFARDVVNAAAEDVDVDVDDHMDDGEDDDSNYNNDDDDNHDDDDDADTDGGINGSTDGGGERRRRRTSSGTRNNTSNSSSNNNSSSTSSSARGASGLADMFAPPRHLICNAGGFEGARANAKDSKRWLLVNLQRDNEFSCHALNRDVWRDELVENLIGEGFIFWQEMDTSPEGSIYAQRYNVYDYPHVGIIDPRTRRLMWKKEGWTQQNPLTAEQFAEYAMDFCSRHSFDRPPQAPRPSSSSSRNTNSNANSNANNSSSSKGLPAKRPMHEMSEDEQLQAAMRASLEDSGAGGGDATAEYDYEMNSDEDNDVVIVDSAGHKVEDDSKPKAIEKKEEATAAAAPPAPQAPASMLDELIPFDIGDEPEKGARIQFRMPDGKRKIRKFDPSQSVKHVYAFVAQSFVTDGTDGKEFVLKAGFPPKDLIGDIKNSIQASSLAGEAITVRWK